MTVVFRSRLMLLALVVCILLAIAAALTIFVMNPHVFSAHSSLATTSQQLAKMYRIITATPPSVTETNFVTTAPLNHAVAQARGPQLAGDFTYVEDMTVQQGDGGGLRIGNCWFTIYPGIQRYDLWDHPQANALTSGTSSNIKQGLNVKNTIALMSRGNRIILFINGHPLAPVIPSGPVSGSWGVVASGAEGHNTTVVAKKASVWFINNPGQ